MRMCKLHSVKRGERAMKVKLAVVGVAVVWLASLLLMMTAVIEDANSGVDYTSAAAIATALDAGGFACTGWTPNVGVIGAHEDGYCTHGEDGTVSITTFSDADQMKTTNNTYAAFETGVPVHGDRWQVSARDNAQATAVQEILGGAVQ